MVYVLSTGVWYTYCKERIHSEYSNGYWSRIVYWKANENTQQVTKNVIER